MAATQGRHVTADKLSADIAHTRHAQHKERHIVTLRYEARAEREARDTRTGLAAEPLVIIKIRDISLNYGLFSTVVSECSIITVYLFTR